MKSSKKRQQQEQLGLTTTRHATWVGIRPAVMQNKKAYNRNRAKQALRKEIYG